MREGQDMPDGSPKIDDDLWPEARDSLVERGYAVLPSILAVDDCCALRAMYGDDSRFRSRIVMSRHQFGEGDYAYFDNPLPPLVARLRRDLYRHLAPIANAVQHAFGNAAEYPEGLDDFVAQCHASGQTKPTPLVLRYGAGGYNRLHRDLYGEVVFPLQAMVMLSDPTQEFDGGEFVLVENRPRQQSICQVLSPNLGDVVIFPVADRPVMGKRGYLRASMRHGVSPVRRGERWTLGIIFHEAA